MADLLKKVISYSGDLVGLLKDPRDPNGVAHCCDSLKALRSSADADFNEVLSLLQDYENKTEACRQKTEAAKSEVVTDEELDLLHKELEEECKREIITNEINDLECTRISVQERNQTLMKIEQDELRAQRTLSMFASVTNIIPDLKEKGFYLPMILFSLTMSTTDIVDRDKKVVKKFEFDPTQMTAFDVCDSIWKAIVRDRV
ncbi:hypothetical protein TIFTF001_009626 [Ficus carica]|uniref:Uncharacterized protein n=1 Tax=Ficus carica TaxID=3494 RepID=A0AA87ZVM1_FICCA|nr:hypothetical protein TIFTF001_009626 [Ficus carica]